MTFSIVVPAYNESGDIRATCEALLRLTPQPEVIVIDDGSTDDTAAIVRQYLTRPSVTLIQQPSNRGQGVARNVGVRAATGDVVVFVDADVRLPPDFLERLAPHYERGADYVEVTSDVSNTESVCARYIYAQQRQMHGDAASVGWSQAFSCRRALALDAGLFPEAFPTVGEDGEFVRRLERRSPRRTVDKSIVVSHTVPGTPGGFWRLWHGRGIALPFFRRQTQHVGWTRLVAGRLAATLWSLLRIVTVVPVVRDAALLAARSGRRWRDFPPFAALRLVQLVAYRSGEWRGLRRLWASRSAGAR
ncbi:MAG: glycosyltransferase family 2 protein [Acidobacteria bacterium]|nr:glycosyltransferase family 2 protein [Acidobacteriota bacterium]